MRITIITIRRIMMERKSTTMIKKIPKWLSYYVKIKKENQNNNNGKKNKCNKNTKITTLLIKNNQ